MKRLGLGVSKVDWTTTFDFVVKLPPYAVSQLLGEGDSPETREGERERDMRYWGITADRTAESHTSI